MEESRRQRPTDVTPSITADKPGTTSSRTRLGWQIPNWEPAPLHVLVCLIAVVAFVVASGPLNEPDLFWHVPLGHDILRLHHVIGAGNGFTFPPGPGHWVSSEWLSEVSLAFVQGRLGWRAIIFLRLLFAVLLLLGVARLVLRRTSGRAGCLIFAAIVVSLTAFIQERPQTLSLIFLLWVTERCAATLRGAAPPGYVLAGGLTFVWAQFHGMWVLLPALLIFAAVCHLIDVGTAGWPVLRRTLSVAGLCFLAGSLTPIGPRGLVLPLSLRAATRHIAEWQLTELLGLYAIGLVSLLGLIMTAWARSSNPAPRSEVLWVAGVTIFSLTAIRNVAPAVLLLAPVVVDRFSAVFPGRVIRTRPLERRILAGMCLLTLGVGAVLGLAHAAVEEPFARAWPARISTSLATDGREHRVLNAYNISGWLISFGGPHTKLVIDGRADRYGPKYLADYFAALSLRDNWQAYVDGLHATDAVLTKQTPLVVELRRQGWTTALTDGAYVLLRAPAPR